MYKTKQKNARNLPPCHFLGLKVPSWSFSLPFSVLLLLYKQCLGVLVGLSGRNMGEYIYSIFPEAEVPGLLFLLKKKKLTTLLNYDWHTAICTYLTCAIWQVLTCVYLWNPHHNQYNAHIPDSPKLPCVTCNPPFSSSSLYLSPLPNPSHAFYTGIIQYVLLFLVTGG